MSEQLNDEQLAEYEASMSGDDYSSKAPPQSEAVLAVREATLRPAGAL